MGGTMAESRRCKSSSHPIFIPVTVDKLVRYGQMVVDELGVLGCFGTSHTWLILRLILRLILHIWTRIRLLSVGSGNQVVARYDASRRVGVELPWHPMEDRELEPAEAIVECGSDNRYTMLLAHRCTQHCIAQHYTALLTSTQHWLLTILDNLGQSFEGSILVPTKHAEQCLVVSKHLIF